MSTFALSMQRIRSMIAVDARLGIFEPVAPPSRATRIPRIKNSFLEELAKPLVLPFQLIESS